MALEPAMDDDGATSAAIIETDEQAAKRIADLVSAQFDGDDIALDLIDLGQARWRLSIFFRTVPDEVSLRALVAAADARADHTLRFERIPAKDWVGASLAGLKPVRAGRFVVHGAHDRAGIPGNCIGIEIEAALAFGTGHHGTTRGCLLALDRLAKARRAAARAPKILDIGTGTGVLAIAAARALRHRVVATDIDAEAVRIAQRNAQLNRAGALVTVVKANGVDAPAVAARAPFDLILANILLGPLQRLAAPVIRRAAPGGRVVLSGLLTGQAKAALAAYRPLALERRIEIDGWTTLILARRARPRRPIARRRPSP